MASSVSVLLFDLGGVLIDFNGVEGLRELLAEPMDDDAILARWATCEPSLAYGVGQMTTEAFMARFAQDWGLPVAPPTLLDAWQTWVRGWLPGAEALLRDLRPRYRLAALSNSNAAHWERLAALGVLEVFDPALGSHQLGLRKPDPAIYAEALARLGVPADAVLFFDDSRANVEAARRAGMQAAHVDGPDSVRRHLTAIGLL